MACLPTPAPYTCNTSPAGAPGHAVPGFMGAVAQLQGRERAYAETVHALNDAQASGQAFDAIASFSAACTSQPTGLYSSGHLILDTSAKHLLSHQNFPYLPPHAMPVRSFSSFPVHRNISKPGPHQRAQICCWGNHRSQCYCLMAYSAVGRDIWWEYLRFLWSSLWAACRRSSVKLLLLKRCQQVF